MWNVGTQAICWCHAHLAQRYLNSYIFSRCAQSHRGLGRPPSLPMLGPRSPSAAPRAGKTNGSYRLRFRTGEFGVHTRPTEKETHISQVELQTSLPRTPPASPHRGPRTRAAPPSPRTPRHAQRVFLFKPFSNCWEGNSSALHTAGANATLLP